MDSLINTSTQQETFNSCGQNQALAGLRSDLCVVWNSVSGFCLKTTSRVSKVSTSGFWFQSESPNIHLVTGSRLCPALLSQPCSCTFRPLSSSVMVVVVVGGGGWVQVVILGVSYQQWGSLLVHPPGLNSLDQTEEILLTFRDWSNHISEIRKGGSLVLHPVRLQTDGQSETEAGPT